uniref:DUF92 domain-containing protein n=1 Tax=Picocystis salinarum TaxID=88271 RepID=A0A7S3XFD5_9CHLO
MARNALRVKSTLQEVRRGGKKAKDKVGRRTRNGIAQPNRTKTYRRTVRCLATLEVDTVRNLLVSDAPGVLFGALANSLVFAAGIKILLRGLTPAGVASSWLLGTLVFGAFGWKGYSIVCLYFVFGSAVTKLKIKQKELEGIAEARSGRRAPSSVWGSGIAAILCSVVALAYPSTSGVMRLGYVTSIASKLADTTSSEVGKAFGKTTFLSTTLKKVPRGTDGAISLEGTLGGVAAATCIGAIASAQGQLRGEDALICGLCAGVANWLESIIGATVQDQYGWLTNDVVNMIQISIAAATSIGIKSMFA